MPALDGLRTPVNPTAMMDWAGAHGVRIFLVVLVALIANRVLGRILTPAIRRAVVRDGLDEERVEQAKRAETLTHVVLGSAAVVIAIVAAFLIVAELGFNIAPVIAGLGISGIAIGLGAQTLVKDGINGLFILGENQFRRGDMVTIANVTGIVEEVSLRRTVLRAEDGTVYTVPNSAITVAGNHTRGYSGVFFSIGLSYLADLEVAIREIDRIGAELAADSELGPLIMEPPRTLRVDSFEDTYLNLRILGRVAPGAQARVTGALRRRIKQEFDRLGIAYRGSAVPAPGVTERQV